MFHVSSDFGVCGITIIMLQAIISEILSPRALSVNDHSGFSSFYLLLLV